METAHNLRSPRLKAGASNRTILRAVSDVITNPSDVVPGPSDVVPDPLDVIPAPPAVIPAKAGIHLL